MWRSDEESITWGDGFACSIIHLASLIDQSDSSLPNLKKMLKIFDVHGLIYVKCQWTWNFRFCRKLRCRRNETFFLTSEMR